MAGPDANPNAGPNTRSKRNISRINTSPKKSKARRRDVPASGEPSTPVPSGKNATPVRTPGSPNRRTNVSPTRLTRQHRAHPPGASITPTPNTGRSVPVFRRTNSPLKRTDTSLSPPIRRKRDVGHLPTRTSSPSPSHTRTVSIRVDSRQGNSAPIPPEEENQAGEDDSSDALPTSRNPLAECRSCAGRILEINDLKGKIKELQEDKSFARNSVNILTEENTRLKQRLNVLQKSKKELLEQVEKVSKRKAQGGKSGSSKSKSIAVHLPEAERTVFDRASNMLERKLFDDITESTINADGTRHRDWLLQDISSRVWKLSGNSSDVGRPMISTDIFHAVPVCPLEQVRNGGIFTSRYKNNESFVHNLLQVAIENDDPPLIPDSEQDHVLSNLEKMLMPLFNAKKRKLTSDLKKRAKCHFLSVLGYSALGRISSVSAEAEQRETERRVLATKLSREIDGIIDPSWWRQASFAELRYSEDYEESEDFQPDMIFKNSAAVLAFQTLRGYSFAEGEFVDDGTILSLARADAWITVSMKLMKEKRTKGGNTGSIYTNEFDTLLPTAAELILKKCRDVLKDKFEHDFLIQSGRNNPFAVAREGTRCFRMPHTKQIYLAVRSSVFASTFTKRLGGVLDCYVGKANDTESKFRPLSVRDDDNDIDTSDDDATLQREG